jgi:hypothetical protein
MSSDAARPDPGRKRFPPQRDVRKNEKACEEVQDFRRDDAFVKALAVRTKEDPEIAEQTGTALLRTRKHEGKSSMNRGI